MLYLPAKAPGEVKDYGFSFVAALESGETISTAVVTATGVTVVNDSAASGIVTVELSGGTLGATGIVTCTITTSSGRTYIETGLVPIGEEPVSLNMAKRQLRAEGTTANDEYLLDLIQSAREHVESYCGIRILPAVVEMTFPSFAEAARLTEAPVQSVSQVTYLDTEGVEQTLASSVYETVNVGDDPLRPAIRLAYNQSWPATRCVSDAVRVSATVGYTVCPRPIIRAMLMLITQWYDVSMPVAIGDSVNELPNAVKDLLANFRRY